MPTNTDRIEKQLTIDAPQSRVWAALIDSQEFGAWFGAKFDGEFAHGKAVRGKLTIPDFEHLTLEFRIQTIQPETLFSYRWHPYAVDPDKDYSNEPMTLVEFKLEPQGSDTRLTIVESGFDQIPADRRSEAFRMNSGGWDAQIDNVAKHVSS